jgi:hypothetical protein
LSRTCQVQTVIDDSMTVEGDFAALAAAES